MDVTVEQAAQLIGRSTRQIMRYINGGKVKAHKSSLGRWHIEVTSLSTIAVIDQTALEMIERAQGITLANALARIEALERELLTLKSVAVIRSYVPTHSQAAPVPVTIPASVGNGSQAVIPSLITVAAARDGLVPGTIRVIEMAKLHDVPPGTLKSQAERNPALSTGIGTGAKNGRQERWCTPDQQRAIIHFWRTHGKRHARCGRSDCACQE